MVVRELFEWATVVAFNATRRSEEGNNPSNGCCKMGKLKLFERIRCPGLWRAVSTYPASEVALTFFQNKQYTSCDAAIRTAALARSKGRLRESPSDSVVTSACEMTLWHGSVVAFCWRAALQITRICHILDQGATFGTATWQALRAAHRTLTRLFCLSRIV